MDFNSLFLINYVIFEVGFNYFIKLYLWLLIFNILYYGKWPMRGVRFEDSYLDQWGAELWGSGAGGCSFGEWKTVSGMIKQGFEVFWYSDDGEI